MHRDSLYISVLSLLMFFLFSVIASASSPVTGEIWCASVRLLPVTESPSGHSKKLALLPYSYPLQIEEVLCVMPDGSDPRENIPKWVKVSIKGTGGYVPANSIVSEWLMENQDTNLVLDSIDGANWAGKKFTDEEEADMTAMKGAAGGAKGGKADYEALDKLLLAKKKGVGIGPLLKSGMLAQDTSALKEHQVEAPSRGMFSKAWGASRKAVSWTMKKGTKFAVSSGIITGETDKVTSTAAAAGDFVYSETGPYQEYLLGRAVAARLLADSRVVDPQSQQARYLQAVGNIVARGSSSPYPYCGYIFALIEGEDPNAFAAPGGIVFVTEGMLSFLKTEDELAAILGHEVAHVELMHGMKSVKQEKVLKLFTLLKKSVRFEERDPDSKETEEERKNREALEAKAMEMFNEIMDKMVSKIRTGYSVEIEAEADARAIEISRIVGYDSMSLAEVLERFKEQKGSYGGGMYPQERGADAVEKALAVDPEHENKALPVRDRRYTALSRKIAGGNQ